MTHLPTETITEFKEIIETLEPKEFGTLDLLEAFIQSDTFLGAPVGSN